MSSSIVRRLAGGLLWLAGAAFAPFALGTPTKATLATAPIRLPDAVRPLAVQLALTIDPAQPTHHGEVEIDVELKAPQRSVQLHARELQVRQAWVELGARRQPARVAPVGHDRIELRFATAVPAGRARIGLVFAGRQQDKELTGLFRRLDGGDWYAATQFQPTAARLAFPLFDEPGWKLPWTLTLTIPHALRGFSNTPLRDEQPAAPGFKRLRFDTTPPLPSYLLAFAVGPFEVLDAPPHGRMPIRFITPRGRSAEALYAAGITARIVERLEAYFGQPIPFTKLDSIALPVPASFGAMEHPGLISYAAPIVLSADPAGRPPPAAFQRDYVSLAAHEIAHQWFGNLVTMAWWDDLWLNESFASWLGDRITDELMPHWGWQREIAVMRARAMRSDRLPSARRVQQPVAGDDDIAQLFDAITYEKGQVVLAMIEQWLGPARLRDGVRGYIDRHAWGSATGADFLAALGRQDPALPDVLRSFITQPGIPRVDAALHCADGERPALRLRQSRLRPLGSTLPVNGSRWQLPLRIRTPGGLTRHLLTAPEETIPLPDAACPAWVQPNDGGVGYYRVALPADALRRLMAQPDLPVAEVLAGLDDAAGLSEAGELPLAELLALAESFARHGDRLVIEQVARVMLQAQPVAAAIDPAGTVARWQRAFGGRARALGWHERAGDSDDERLLRALLVPLVSDLGEDAALRTQAGERARAWLARSSNPVSAATESTARDMTSALLATAAIDGDSELFDALLGAVRRSRDSAERIELFNALGRFRAPVLARRARQLLLDPAFDFVEVGDAVLTAHAQTPALRESLLAFLGERHAQLVRRMGRDEPAWLPWTLSQSCSDADVQRIERVFARHAPRYAGGPQWLAQTLEAVRLCAAWRAHQAGAPA